MQQQQQQQTQDFDLDAGFDTSASKRSNPDSKDMMDMSSDDTRNEPAEEHDYTTDDLPPLPPNNFMSAYVYQPIITRDCNSMEICTYACTGGSHNGQHGIVICRDLRSGEADLRRSLRLSDDVRVVMEASSTMRPYAWPLVDYGLSSSKSEYRDSVLMSPALWTAFFSTEELVQGIDGPTRDHIVRDGVRWNCAEGQVFCAIADDAGVAEDLICNMFYMVYSSACQYKEPQERFQQLLASRLECHNRNQTIIVW